MFAGALEILISMSLKSTLIISKIYDANIQMDYI